MITWAPRHKHFFRDIVSLPGRTLICFVEEQLLRLCNVRKTKKTVSSQIVFVHLKSNKWSFFGWSVVSTPLVVWKQDELFFLMFLFVLGLFLVCFESNSWFFGCCDATGWLEAAR